MKQTLCLAAAAAIAATCGLTGTAAAATIVHDTVAEFTTIDLQQGKATGSTATPNQSVAANRSVLANMFDNDNSTLLSLGLGGTGAGGTLSLLIAPTDNVITSGSVIELTNVGSGHKEKADLFLGTNLGSWVKIGTLFNDALGATVSVVANPYATLSAVDGNGPTTYSLTVLSGSFNSLRLEDKSEIVAGNRDGFDIAELRITSVPEPATLALLGAGLLGLAGLQRVRRRA